MATRGRAWCGTVNNWTAEDEAQLRALGAKYLVVGKEGKDVAAGATPHLQWYAEFENARTFNSLKAALPRAHLEKRKGTAVQAADYCKKEGDFTEEGAMSAQGTRSDLAGVCAEVLAGTPIAAIALSHPLQFVKFGRGLAALSFARQEHRTMPPSVHWRWGQAGVGKTRAAMEAPGTSYVKDGTQWWDGYAHEDKIIIDDFDGRWPFRDFLRLLDRYPYMGQCKGGYVKVNSPAIWITCEYAPEHFWVGNELAQVARRLTSVIEVA